VEIKANTLRGPCAEHVFVHWWQETGKAEGGEDAGWKPALPATKPVCPGTVIALREAAIGEQVKWELVLEAGPSRIVLGKPVLPLDTTVEMVGRELEPKAQQPVDGSWALGSRGAGTTWRQLPWAPG